jgi:hypothetical protein
VSQLEDVLATLGTLDDEAKQALAQLVSEAEYKNREQSILEARKASEAEYNRRRAAGEFEAEAV